MSIKFKLMRGAIKVQRTVSHAAPVIAAGVATGAAIGHTQAEPGLRKEGMKEGAFAGLLISGAVLGRKAIAREAADYGKFVFRRIKGRIVRIKVK